MKSFGVATYPMELFLHPLETACLSNHTTQIYRSCCKMALDARENMCEAGRGHPLLKKFTNNKETHSNSHTRTEKQRPDARSSAHEMAVMQALKRTQGLRFPPDTRSRTLRSAVTARPQRASYNLTYHCGEGVSKKSLLLGSGVKNSHQGVRLPFCEAPSSRGTGGVRLSCAISMSW